MDVVSGLLNTVMGKFLFPDPHGSCALLPRLMDELEELKHLQSTDSLDFPGSTMLSTPPERRIWMSKIYQDRPIGQIVWPATNKSATNKIGLTYLTRPFGQHQTLSIYYQLRNGVRALDIRVQQDSLVCNGNLLSYSIADVIIDIKKFLSETQYEIIVLEIQTERGYRDPSNFETYLVDQLGDLLINQDDHVFSKTISQLLPSKIICVWKPKNSPRPSAGGPIWSASYLRGDEFETELPLTKFNANLINLSQQIPASERNYFYKVEHILTPHASSATEWMLVWPRLANFVSKRINDFARFFLAKCASQDILDRLQIYSTDFISDDFIIACIALNHSMDIKVQCSHSVETIEARKLEFATRKLEMMEKHSQDLELKFEKEQAVLKERNISSEMKLKSAEKDKEHLEMMMQKYRQELEQKVKNLEVQLETTKVDSTENMQQAVKEKNRAIQIQRDFNELKNKFKELLAIQQQGPRNIGFFGTRNMGFMHQELIEILSYAMVITKNHIFTSGGSGTNAAVIRGALRAEMPELLTVILPQSLHKQSPESQELLSKVKHVVQKPYNDHLPLIEACSLCTMDIVSQVQQVICFAFHDSRLLMEKCQEAKNMRKIVTLFYLD